MCIYGRRCGYKKTAKKVSSKSTQNICADNSIIYTAVKSSRRLMVNETNTRYIHKDSHVW